MVLKLKVRQTGKHIRVAHFTGVDRDHLQHSGEVVLGSVGDWQEYGAALTRGCNELRLASGRPLVDLIVDDWVLEEWKMRTMSNKLLKAKSLVQEVMDAWPSLPDEIDASSGQLEQVIELIGQVEGDIDAYESGDDL